MKSLSDHGSMHPSGQTRAEERNSDDQSAVVGNERMTALAGAVLLVLILVELVSAAYLRTLLSAHVFAGVILVGPLVVKLGSTGSRFLRYYTKSPAFVRKGPPRLGAADSGPTADRHDSRGDRQWDWTRGDWPALCWPTPPPAWLQCPGLAPADRHPCLCLHLAGPTSRRERLEQTIRRASTRTRKSARHEPRCSTVWHDRRHPLASRLRTVDRLVLQW